MHVIGWMSIHKVPAIVVDTPRDGERAREVQP
jgi:hypothetical protein